MKRIGLRFPKWARLAFSIGFLVSLTTGILWFCLGRWGDVEGEFGPEKHPWLGVLAKLHGAGAFFAMIAFGMIWAAHVPVGWRSQLSRKSGLFTIACGWLLIITAYGLYYCGSDDWRSRIVWVHLTAGLLLPVSIVLHVRQRLRQRR